jgi:hypothetical protein
MLFLRSAGARESGERTGVKTMSAGSFYQDTGYTNNIIIVMKNLMLPWLLTWAVRYNERVYAWGGHLLQSRTRQLMLLAVCNIT